MLVAHRGVLSAVYVSECVCVYICVLLRKFSLSALFFSVREGSCVKMPFFILL